MQFQLLALALAAVASASSLQARDNGPICDGTGNAIACCATDVLGDVIVSSCVPPKGKVNTRRQFDKACAKQNLNAYCCTINIAGLCVLADQVDTGTK